MVMGALMLGMLFLAGTPKKTLLLILLPILLAVPVLILAEPYRLRRLMAFLDPWASPQDEGYQLIQSLYALANGDLFGVGLFSSRQKYRFLPFAESDFILSVIAEETGFFGVLCLFLLIGFVAWRGFRIAANAHTFYEYLLVSGIMFAFAVQAALNALVVSGCVPPTGLPLPLVSAGNTSLIVTMAGMGSCSACHGGKAGHKMIGKRPGAHAAKVPRPCHLSRGENYGQITHHRGQEAFGERSRLFRQKRRPAALCRLRAHGRARHHPRRARHLGCDVHGADPARAGCRSDLFGRRRHHRQRLLLLARDPALPHAGVKVFRLHARLALDALPPRAHRVSGRLRHRAPSHRHASFGAPPLGRGIDEHDGYIFCKCEKLKGAEISLDFPSVGATENVLLAAVMAEGETVLRGAAREPEIVDLARFLQAMGAKICGAGTDVIVIEGVKKLRGVSYAPMKDRIEAGTYLIMAAVCGGEVETQGAAPENLGLLLHKLRENGCKIGAKNDKIRLESTGKLKCNRRIETMPFPGFPTDLQAQAAALNSGAEGCALIEENLFETRFKYVPELIKMGADIEVKGRTAFIRGAGRLHGATLLAGDLRGAAALVVAALGAEGTSEVLDLSHLDRGYEDLPHKLRKLGADIKRVRV